VPADAAWSPLGDGSDRILPADLAGAAHDTLEPGSLDSDEGPDDRRARLGAGTVAQIPVRYTQSGEQVSPALSWTNVPARTVWLLLHVHDPDVARNKTTDDQLHWLVWNLPATATGLPEGVAAGAERPDGSLQISARGPNDRGPGAAAAGRLHHYTFEIYALDTKVDVATGGDPFETRTVVLKAIQGHVLGKAVYVGLFHRPQ